MDTFFDLELLREPQAAIVDEPEDARNLRESLDSAATAASRLDYSAAERQLLFGLKLKTHVTAYGVQPDFPFLQQVPLETKRDVAALFVTVAAHTGTEQTVLIYQRALLGLSITATATDWAAALRGWPDQEKSWGCAAQLALWLPDGLTFLETVTGEILGCWSHASARLLTTPARRAVLFNALELVSQGDQLKQAQRWLLGAARDLAPQERVTLAQRVARAADRVGQGETLAQWIANLAEEDPPRTAAPGFASSEIPPEAIAELLELWIKHARSPVESRIGVADDLTQWLTTIPNKWAQRLGEPCRRGIYHRLQPYWRRSRDLRAGLLGDLLAHDKTSGYRVQAERLACLVLGERSGGPRPQGDARWVASQLATMPREARHIGADLMTVFERQWVASVDHYLTTGRPAEGYIPSAQAASALHLSPVGAYKGNPAPGSGIALPAVPEACTVSGFGPPFARDRLRSILCRYRTECDRSVVCLVVEPMGDVLFITSIELTPSGDVRFHAPPDGMPNLDLQEAFTTYSRTQESAWQGLFAAPSHHGPFARVLIGALANLLRWMDRTLAQPIQRVLELCGDSPDVLLAIGGAAQQLPLDLVTVTYGGQTRPLVHHANTVRWLSSFASQERLFACADRLPQTWAYPLGMMAYLPTFLQEAYGVFRPDPQATSGQGSDYLELLLSSLLEGEPGLFLDEEVATAERLRRLVSGWCRHAVLLLHGSETHLALILRDELMRSLGSGVRLDSLTLISCHVGALEGIVEQCLASGGIRQVLAFRSKIPDLYAVHFAAQLLGPALGGVGTTQEVDLALAALPTPAELICR